MIQFDEHIFQMGWNHQLVRVWNRLKSTKQIAVEKLSLSLNKCRPAFGGKISSVLS